MLTATNQTTTGVAPTMIGSSPMGPLLPVPPKMVSANRVESGGGGAQPTHPARQYPSAEHSVRSGPKRYCGRKIEERERHPGPRPDSADDRGIGPGPAYKYC